jgi:hypothetical protein
MRISDGLTQGTKVIGHALHLATVVASIEVALLESAEPSVELQNTRLAVAEELSLNREPCLACYLCRLPNDLVEFRGEGVEDLYHHNAVQSCPIDEWIDDVREDVVVEGIAMKREEHEVAPPLVFHSGDNNVRNTPPPLTHEQVLIMQAQILQTMQQTIINMPQTIFNLLQGHQQESQPHQRDRL